MDEQAQIEVQPEDSPLVSTPPQMKRSVIWGLILLLLLLCTVTFIFISLNFQRKNSIATDSQIVATTIPSPPLPTPAPENIKAITDNVELTYWLTPKDEKTTIYKKINFKTNTPTQVVLPHPKTLVKPNNTTLQSDYVYYEVSPNNKYVARISSKKLEVSPLTASLKYKTIHEVPIKEEPFEHNPEMKVDFLKMGDVYWLDDNTIYFLVSSGLDGVGTPKGGSYSDLYSVQMDGSNKDLLNDHTKDNQNYGFMRQIYAVDTKKQEVYLSSNTHGGHIGGMDVVSLITGEIVKSLKGTTSDAGNPVFNNDFSKAYYIKSLVHSDGYLPTHLYEYDMDTGTNKLLYTVPNFTNDGDSPSFGSNGSGLRINPVTNTLYFEEDGGGERVFYQFDILSKQKKLLYTYDNKENCWPAQPSKNGKYLLLSCSPEKETQYFIYDIEKKARSNFYTGPIEIINFN